MRGGVLWEKIYKWNKYNLKPVYKNITRTGEIWVTVFEVPKDSGFNFLLGESSSQLREALSGNSGINEYSELRSRESSGNIIVEGRKTYQYTEKVFDYYTQGDFIGEVQSKNKDQYPSNGKSGNYWYVLKK